MYKAIFTFSTVIPFLHIKYAETPIRRKSDVQTGPNIELGGVNDGLFIVAYQVGMEGVVKSESTNPANWQTTMLTPNFRISIIFALHI
jgi:hypothetical protein